MEETVLEEFVFALLDTLVLLVKQMYIASLRSIPMQIGPKPRLVKLRLESVKTIIILLIPLEFALNLEAQQLGNQFQTLAKVWIYCLFFSFFFECLFEICDSK